MKDEDQVTRVVQEVVVNKANDFYIVKKTSRKVRTQESSSFWSPRSMDDEELESEEDVNQLLVGAYKTYN